MDRSPSPVLLSLVVLIGLVSLGVGLHQSRKAADSRAELATASERRRHAEQALVALTRESAVAAEPLASFQAGPIAPTPSPVAPATRPVPSAGLPAPRDVAKEKADWQRFIVAHPEAQRVMIEKYKDQMRG